MYGSVSTGALYGVEACPIAVEIDISTGLPGFTMVGLLSNEVREAKERVTVALKNTDFHLPPQKITVNMSPANLRKDGTGFDLPIAIGILQALGYFDPARAADTVFVGELGLDGEVKPVRGILPIAKMAAAREKKCIIVPWDNRTEACVVPGIQVRGVKNIRQLVTYLQEEDAAYRDSLLPLCPTITMEDMKAIAATGTADMADVKGQEIAKRAAEIAAAGFHNLLMSGPPGGGKSMISRRLPGILPTMTWQESMEVSAIYSVAGLLNEEKPLVTERPFQSPHHTISSAALIGGGVHIKPGAISLAHRGVLFLDELTEFPRNILECLRQPLEEKQVNIARVHGNYRYPANFMLVCAMNPCKCGYYPDRNKCRCTESEISHYWNKLSGPLLDRIDMYVETSRIEIGKLQNEQSGDSSETIRERVRQAREIQQERFRGTGYLFNGDMEPHMLERFCMLGREEKELMETAYTALDLSARTYHRILKVARTIADLEGEERVRTWHLEEALAYRITEGAWKKNE